MVSCEIQMNRVSATPRAQALVLPRYLQLGKSVKGELLGKGRRWM